MNKISWTWDPSQVPPSAFLLDYSVDKGLTYQTLVTVPFDVNGSSYNQKEKRFFYDHVAGTPGTIYRIVAQGSFGDSEPSYVLAPPAAPEICVVVGYVRDILGAVDQSISIHVEARGTSGEHWVKGPEGIVAQHPQALSVQSRIVVVHPNEYGQWQVGVLQGAYCRITIPELDFVWMFEVPSVSGPVNIRDIPQLRGKDIALFPSMNGDRPYFPES